KPVCFLNNFLNLDANLSDNIIISEKPSMIKDYDNFMGGVDVYDKMVKTYLSDRKTIKWSNKITMYLLNLIVHNSYILYKEFYRGQDKIKSSLNFRKEIIESLLSYEPRSKKLAQENALEHMLIKIINRRSNCTWCQKKRF
ncbi:PiggyBac transposable element-derived protein 4, partial [Dictyocoela muelleri]